ncbi:hypothetical protein EV682_103394 [Iodobacter fluviatilis]|uniref:Uncharacterized protein n=1 Tax=Iodobacter fluviatilis TaxID=537 RepID=A0A377Q8T1_9NEIS|nr:hypothetical protein EV682_103394 [Iodobacter fluviatilis]STQ91118.1 Uncharacterised protein [Iodobacter fluviatilis]
MQTFWQWHMGSNLSVNRMALHSPLDSLGWRHVTFAWSGHARPDSDH